MMIKLKIKDYIIYIIIKIIFLIKRKIKTSIKYSSFNSINNKGINNNLYNI